MNPLGRKVKIAHHRVPLVLLLLIVVGTAAAVSYIVYQFNVSLPVERYPKVTFWNWNTLEKVNTFTYSVTIFPNIKTIDENITHGIFCDDSSGHTCHLRISNVGNPGNIAKLDITIYNSSSTVFTEEWTSFSSLPTDWEPFTAAPGAKYRIRIEVTASPGATIGTTSSFTIEMKIEEP